MAKENALENASLKDLEGFNEDIDDFFDLDELEKHLESQLQEEMADLEFLEQEKEMIGNPDSLGKVILDEVWKQIGNQIGLDMTNETTIQEYNRKHPETYAEVGKAVMQDKRYKDANNAMKEQQKSGSLIDEYTGRTLSQNGQANLDHVVSRKEIYENPRRKQANLSTEELANKPENLKATNESLNKSKNAQSINEYNSNRPQREQNLIEQNERANKKIDESNMSDAEKRLQKEKNNKRLQDKLNADKDLMEKADKEARKAINKDISKGAVKEVGKKAGKDALKQMAISALFSMMKEIMSGFVRFLKAQTKSFKSFLEEMKKSVKSFLANITNVLQTGASSIVGTVLSEIFGPIVSLFKKLASLIKQGVSSFIEAVKVFKNKEFINMPFSLKVAQVGKIILSGLTAIGAIGLGEVIESLLRQIPGMQIEIPIIGSLASVIGIALASLICGLVGAIVVNFIDKFIAKRQKSELAKSQIEKGNEVLNLQHKIAIVSEAKLAKTKEDTFNSIINRHNEAATVMSDAVRNIEKNCEADNSVDKSLQSVSEDLNNLLSEIGG